MRVIGQSGIRRFVSFGSGLSAAVAAGFVLSAVVAAQPAAAQRANAEELCTPDVMRLCGEAIPDRGKIVACLKRKRFALSPGCRQVFSPPKAKKRRAVRKRG